LQVGASDRQEIKAMMLTKTRVIALVVLLVGAGDPLSAPLDGATSAAASTYPPCVLINRPPPPFGDRLTAHRPAVPLPAPGVCTD
jgi:hypothetical protein